VKLVDVAILVILIFSTVAAIRQGFVRELFSLAGLILGLLVASRHYLALATPLSRWIHSPGIADALAFLCIALGIMLVAGLIGSTLQQAVEFIGLGWADGILGAGFGFVRGCLLVMVALLTLAAFRPGAPWLQGSRLVPYFLPGASFLSAQAPPALKEKVLLGVTFLEHPKAIFVDTMEPVSN
jgi:membrane protein required for colicin V production